MLKRWIKIGFPFFLVLALRGLSVAQKASKSYAVTKLNFNSQWSDISPVLLPNGLAFVSNREDQVIVSRFSETLSEPFYRFYFAEKNGKDFAKPVRLKGEVNDKFSEGPISFSPDFKTIYFSRNLLNQKQTRSGKKARFGLFTGSFQNGQVQNVKSFPFNHSEYSVAHPTVSSNGNFIIFSSNVPGGFGASDLYVSYNKSGKWEKPINLGKEINTSSDEVFPFISSDGTLFFSSSGHGGNGGLDIFSANYQNFEWNGVANLGSSLNTPFDDFGYTESADKTSGFFCSNREKKFKDDIYHFKVANTSFEDCDSLKELSYCRTFYEESTMNTDSLPLIYEWDFGSGVKMKGNEVNHCFDKPGKYMVNLNIIDLITNQLYMNEASYEIEIEPINGPYFSVSDTISSGVTLELDASKSKQDNAIPLNYFWDFGDGTLTKGSSVVHAFKTKGKFPVRLGVNFKSSTGLYSKCVVKNVNVVDPTYYLNKKQSVFKPYYNIRDKSGNSYKIQLVTSKEKMNTDAFYFKEIGNVEEYYDRGIFGYTVGNYERPELCYPELKKVREKGFKEALVIAMKENKVVSGTDASFFVKLPSNFKFVRLVSIYGKVLNSDGHPVNTTVKLEELYTGTFLDEFPTDSTTGRYKIDLPIDKAYAYYIEKKGFFPFSSFIDLTKENDLSEIRSDIFLMPTEKMIKDTVAMRVNNLFFLHGEIKPKPESLHELERLAEYFKMFPKAYLSIEGHSDNIGDKYSRVLFAQRRADAVKRILVELGCDSERMIAKSYGESKPLTLNPKMQHINNRIEIRLLMKK